jgi:hypothetical protein
MNKYVLIAIGLAIFLLPGLVSFFEDLSTFGWIVVVVVAIGAVIGGVSVWGELEGQKTRDRHQARFNTYLQEAKAENDQEAIRYFSQVGRYDYLLAQEKKLSGGIENQREALEFIDWAVEYEARSSHPFVAHGKLVTEIVKGLKQEISDARDVVGEHDESIRIQLQAELDDEKDQFEREQNREKVDSAAVKLAGLAGALTADDAHLNQGLGAINKTLVDLMKLDGELLCDEELQASLRMLSRRISEETIVHEPIERKLEKLLLVQ